MKWRVPLILCVLLVCHHADAADHRHGKSLPHPDNPVLQAEHLELLDLVPDANVTHTVVRDGLWSDKGTWKDGILPTANANVLIPLGKIVTVDHVSELPLRTVRVDGKLQFAADRDTKLLVDTLVIAPEGWLVIGT